VLKEGYYTAIATDFQLTETKKGEPQIRLDWSIETPEGNYNKVQFLRFSDEVFKDSKGNEFTPTDILVKTLLLAGYIGGDEGLTKPFISVFNPQKVQLTLKNRVFNNETQLEIKYVNPLKEKRQSKAYAGQAPKMGAVFAKWKKELGIQTNPLLED
jgi:hypothetical protein